MPNRTVAPALAPARGMLGRVLYAAASFHLLIYTMDSQPTDKVEGVGDDFVRGGQDKTPIKQIRKYYRTRPRPHPANITAIAHTQRALHGAQGSLYLICPAAHLPSCSSPVAAVSRRWPWRTATSTWQMQILPHPPTPSVLCTASKHVPRSVCVWGPSSLVVFIIKQG